jgi:HPt (histidine-containing phosphotransfer) domain-containing protein
MADRFGGYLDEATMRIVVEIAPIFKENSLTALLTMREALAQRDRERLVMAAHTLKGTSGNLGLGRLSQLCEHLEELAEADAFAAAALELRRLAAEYRQVQEVLDQLQCPEQQEQFFQDDA